MDKRIYIDPRSVLPKTEEQPHDNCINRYFSVIAIQYFGSSGSIFLQSLLDSHPNLITLPATNSRGFYTFWHQYSAHTQRNKNHLLQSFVAAHAYLFDPLQVQKVYALDKMGENADQVSVVDFKQFCTSFLKFLHNIAYPSRKQFFIAIHLAYAQALNRDTARIFMIVFPIHGLPAEQAQWLLADFPDLKFVHTVREPLINLASSLKHKMGTQLIGSFVEYTFAQILCGIKQQLYPQPMNPHGETPYLAEVQDVSRAIRLEDLHQNFEMTMRQLSQWLGIPWHPQLQQSTFNGLKWWNRQGSLFISGASQAILAQSYDSYFTWFDRFRFKMLSAKKYQCWQYPLQAPALLRIASFLLFFTLLWPFKIERQTFSTRLKLTRQKCLEIVTLPFHNLLICLQPLWLGKLIAHQEPPIAKQRIETKLEQWLGPLLALYLWVRDFGAVRYWLYRAWWEELFADIPLVPLLTAADITHNRASQLEKAEQFFAAKQYEPALGLYQCLTESTELSREQQEKLACCGYFTHQWEVCSQYGTRVLQEQPGDLSMHHMVVEAWVKQDAWDEAEAQNENALKHGLPEANILTPYYHLGEHFLRANQSRSAMKIFHWLSERYPTRLDFRFALAQSYLSGEEWLAAKTHLEIIIKAAPTNSETLFMLARVCENLAEKQNAHDYYQRLLRLQPAHMGAHQGLLRTR